MEPSASYLHFDFLLTLFIFCWGYLIASEKIYIFRGEIKIHEKVSNRRKCGKERNVHEKP